MSYITSVLTFPNVNMSPVRRQEFVGSWVSPLLSQNPSEEKVVKRLHFKRTLDILTEDKPMEGYAETTCSPGSSWRLKERRRKPCVPCPNTLLQAFPTTGFGEMTFGLMQNKQKEHVLAQLGFFQCCLRQLGYAQAVAIKLPAIFFDGRGTVDFKSSRNAPKKLLRERISRCKMS